MRERVRESESESVGVRGRGGVSGREGGREKEKERMSE